MSGHTPGPWAVAEALERSIKARVVLGAGGQVVALVVPGEDHVADGGSEREANARLMAAAPDLLALVRTAQDFMDAISKGETWTDGAYRDAGEWVADAGATLAAIDG